MEALVRWRVRWAACGWDTTAAATGAFLRAMLLLLSSPSFLPATPFSRGPLHDGWADGVPEDAPEEGRLYVWGNGESFPRLVPFPPGEVGVRVAKVCLGESHAALLSGDTLPLPLPLLLTR